MPDTSIFDDTKQVLGVGATNAFDTDVLMHLNMALGTLQDIGVGPIAGVVVSDSTTKWSALTDIYGNFFMMVKTYVYVKTRLTFDPPPTSFAIAAIEKQIEELEFRLNSMAETLAPISDPSCGIYWWDLTGGLAFPDLAESGDIGWDSVTGDVWRNGSSSEDELSELDELLEGLGI